MSNELLTAQPELVVPFVVRIERVDPPTRTDALEAAARGVLLLLARPEPDWISAVTAWNGQRIRKVVRRARGVEWRRAEDLPGRTVRSGSAEVRVYPPIPIDAWPRDLARLQVGGTELADPSVPPVESGTPLILLSPYVELTAGKAMAQAAHAAQLGWRASSAAAQEAWAERGFPLAVRTATPAAWREAAAVGAPVVQDAGFTEVAPGTRTAVALLPWLGSAADQSSEL